VPKWTCKVAIFFWQWRKDERERRDGKIGSVEIASFHRMQYLGELADEDR